MKAYKKRIKAPAYRLDLQFFDSSNEGKVLRASCLFLVRSGNSVIEKLGSGGFTPDGDFQIRINMDRFAYFLEKGLRIPTSYRHAKPLIVALMALRQSLSSAVLPSAQPAKVKTPVYFPSSVRLPDLYKTNGRELLQCFLDAGADIPARFSELEYIQFLNTTLVYWRLMAWTIGHRRYFSYLNFYNLSY